MIRREVLVAAAVGITVEVEEVGALAGGEVLSLPRLSDGV